MNAEALALAEPAEGSAGGRAVCRRILAATFLAFVFLVLLGGRSRADVLDPAENAVDSATETVGQVVETASQTVSTAVDAASEGVTPIVETATDARDAVVHGLRPVREAVERLLPGTKSIVQHPPDPHSRPPISGEKPRNAWIPPGSHADRYRASAAPVARSPGTGSWSPSSIAHPGTDTDGVPASGGSRGHGGGFVPFGPFGRGVADGPLTLIALLAALAASLAVRPPPLRRSLAPRVAAPNVAALALSVERPG
jgi:hypothetical protein